MRHIGEEFVRHKGIEMEIYKPNGILEDAGCPRVHLAPVIDANLATYPHLGNVKPRAATGIKVRKAPGALVWINLPFSQVKMTDIEGFTLSLRSDLIVLLNATAPRRLCF